MSGVWLSHRPKGGSRLRASALGCRFRAAPQRAGVESGLVVEQYVQVELAACHLLSGKVDSFFEVLDLALRRTSFASLSEILTL